MEGPGGIQKKHALIYWARMCAAGVPAGPKSFLGQGMTAPYTRYRWMGPDMDPTIPRSSSIMVGPTYPRPADGQAVVPGIGGWAQIYRIYTTTEIRYHSDTTQINLSDMVDKMRSNRSAEREWLEHLRPEQPVQITDPNFHTDAGGWAEACSGKWATDGPKMCEDRPSGLHVILKIMTDGPTVDLISEKANWPSAYADVVSETVTDGPSPLCLDLEKATDGPSPPWV
ncbi:hypothetical protein C8R48DRAFT_675228 [Suillus tomentosus]|nr:hypothetical protein C8R48DRAFT_675228 [Suillus tomentosus]